MSERDQRTCGDGATAEDSEVTISKLEAARTQLETAISLFFQEKDVVSIHTLVAAAYTIIQDVNKGRGGSPMITKGLIPMLVPQHKRKSVYEKLNSAQNFFKHADRDLDATLTFRPSVTPLLIFDAALKYHEMTGESPVGVNVFMWWLLATMPDLWLLPDAIQERARQLAPSMRGEPRQAFYAFMKPLVPALPDLLGAATHEAIAEFIAGIEQQASKRRSDNGESHGSP